jgi:pimeloyl-ACP methyl ester carboxylesterase
MADQNRTLVHYHDDDGLPCWISETSPVSMTSRAECLVPPDRIIPIVFVPGIMGSNLKAIDTSKAQQIPNIWRPDATSAVVKIIKLSPADRQIVFDPRNSKVDGDLVVNGTKVVKATNGFSDVLLKARGWGTVYWASYGPFLEYLERELNNVVTWNPAFKQVLPEASWLPFQGEGVNVQSDGKTHPLKLSADELKKVGKYWYPVHAVGYNWLQSNEQSGKYLAGEIEKILAHYRGKWGSKAVKKVILVTHSMGGLVARAAVHPKMGNAQDNVLGILHGAMPALGAPAAYKRMKAGNERAGMSPVSFATWLFLGAYGWDVTPVLAQSPGGLQLLPNQDYPGGWLTIKVNSDVYRIDGNPYKSVYVEKNKWWRLVNPSWLNPANLGGALTPTGQTSSGGRDDVAWAKYMNCLQSAENFHATLQNSYHPQTYAFYGADPGHESWGKIQWNIGTERYVMRGPMSVFDTDAELKTLALNGKPGDDDGAGTIETTANASWMGDIHERFEIQPAGSNGDGTVPHESGLAPGKTGGAIEQFSLTGFDHQGAYMTEVHDVMAVSKYAIAKIAQKADWGDA